MKPCNIGNQRNTSSVLTVILSSATKSEIGKIPCQETIPEDDCLPKHHLNRCISDRFLFIHFSK